MSEWIKCDRCNKMTKADSSGDKRYKIGVDGFDGYSVFHLCEGCLRTFYSDFLQWKWNDNECQYVPQAKREDKEMSKRPIDKTKKSNIKCKHCIYADRPTQWDDTWYCALHQKEVKYWNRCKSFEWVDSEG